MAGAPGQGGSTVFDERVRLLYRLSLPGYPGTLIISAVVATALIAVVPAFKVMLWLGLSLAVTAVRYRLYRRFCALAPADAELPRWRHRFVAGAAVMGVVWGMLGAWLMPCAEFM